MRGLLGTRNGAGLLLSLVLVSGGMLHASPFSSDGKEFYAVSLPNPLLPDQSRVHFGIGVANPGNGPMSVTVSGGSLGAPLTFSVPARSSQTTALPWVSDLSTSLSTIKRAGGAYRIVLSQPGSITQFNPIDSRVGTLSAGTGDASLLVSVPSAATAYRAVVWPTGDPGSMRFPGHIAIVATEPATTVTVVAPGTVQEGAGLGPNGGTLSLDAGDVLLVASTLVAGADLSGTQITSSAPVLVWVGHAAANVPLGRSYADHLEASLPPLSALGTDYLVVRPGNPSGAADGARHQVKIVGTADGTTLTLDPPIPGGPAMVNAGQSTTFEATADFRLRSSQPVVVGLFMEGSQSPGFSGLGDPSQFVLMPTNLQRQQVDFVALSAHAPVFAQLIAPEGASISLDGTPVSGWSAAIGGSGHVVAHVALCCTDSHRAVGNQPFTTMVYAYPPQYMSYWYPGSLGPSDRIFEDGFE